MVKPLVSTLWLLAFIIACGLVLAFTYRATGGDRPTCDHGASSIYAWTDSQGRIHTSKPVTTGCVPPGPRSP